MTDCDMHEPDYPGTTTEEWDAPQQEDFETDDLSDIGSHFILVSSGFRPMSSQISNSRSWTQTIPSTRTLSRLLMVGP